MQTIRFLLSNLARVLALAFIVACPWYYGSAPWDAQLACVLAAMAIFALTMISTDWRSAARPSPLHVCLAFLVGLSLIQTIPLPDPLWNWLSPNADFASEVQNLADELAATDNSGQIQDIAYPRSISLFRQQTLACAAVLASALALLVAGTMLFTSVAWRIALLTTLFATGLAHALLGLLQSVAWDGWTLLDMPTPSYFSTFVNRSSAGQYYSIALGAGVGLLIWLYGQKNASSLDRRYHVRYPAVNMLAKLRRRMESMLTDLDAPSTLCLVGCTLLVAATLAANSRGGILACLLALFAAILVTLSNQSNMQTAIVVILVGGGGCLLFLSVFELDSVISNRLDTLSQEAYELSNVRFQLWSMVLGRSSYWLLGSGYGTFHLAVLPCYDLERLPWFYHAENIYVEVMVTLGIFGFIALLVGVVSTLRRLSQSLSGKSKYIAVAVFLPILAIGLHSLTDFGLMLPAIFGPLCLLAGAFLGGGEKAKSTSRGRKSESRHLRSSRNKPRSAKSSYGTAFERKKAPKVAETEAQPAVASGTTSKQSTAPKSRSKRQHADASYSSSHQRSSPLARYLALAAIILLAISLGLPALDDLSNASKLASGPQSSMTISTRYENARLQQAQYSQFLLDTSDWPEELNEKSRIALSRPEMVTAALCSQDERFELLLAFAQAAPDVLEQLKATGQQMADSIAASPQDYRLSWGVLRADIDLLGPAERERNAARLLLTTRHVPNLARAIGTHYLWCKQRTLGLAFWKNALAADNSSTRYVRRLLGDLLSPEELLAILPESPLLRVQTAKDLSNDPALSKFTEALLLSVGFEQAAEAAQNTLQWQLVAWFADKQGDIEAKLDALERASQKAPSNHALNYQIAQTLTDLGRYEDAREELARALRGQPENAAYKKLQAELEQAIASGE